MCQNQKRCQIDIECLLHCSSLDKYSIKFQDYPDTLVTGNGRPRCPAFKVGLLWEFWTFDHKLSHIFLQFLGVQIVIYSTLSISLWAFEILALSLGVFSPTWKGGSWKLIWKNIKKNHPKQIKEMLIAKSYLLSKELHLLFEAKLCSVWWSLWVEMQKFSKLRQFFGIF